MSTSRNKNTTSTIGQEFLLYNPNKRLLDQLQIKKQLPPKTFDFRKIGGRLDTLIQTEFYPLHFPNGDILNVSQLKLDQFKEGTYNLFVNGKLAGRDIDENEFEEYTKKRMGITDNFILNQNEPHKKRMLEERDKDENADDGIDTKLKNDILHEIKKNPTPSNNCISISESDTTEDENRLNAAAAFFLKNNISAKVLHGGNPYTCDFDTELTINMQDLSACKTTNSTIRDIQAAIKNTLNSVATKKERNIMQVPITFFDADDNKKMLTSFQDAPSTWKKPSY